jgi:predicted Zn-dependent protease with MMP-like domain
MPPGSPTTRRIGLAAALALCVGLTIVVGLQGFSANGVLRVVEGLAVVTLVVGVVFGLALTIAVRLAGWREPSSEAEFDKIVRRAELLAQRGEDGMVFDDDTADEEPDPLDDEGFEAVVREALDELPDLLRTGLARVPVVISDAGHRRGAYGVYEGGTVAREDRHDRIVIFRDTLRRDFGSDRDALREQIVVTVRHELAHHLGADELGVREMGLW